jgi:hypothetical protein
MLLRFLFYLPFLFCLFDAPLSHICLISDYVLTPFVETVLSIFVYICTYYTIYTKMVQVYTKMDVFTTSNLQATSNTCKRYLLLASYLL